MCAPSAPSPTPPAETSAAATGTNVSTAISNAYLTNMDETGPNGSKDFTQTGTQTVTDPYTGQTYEVPTFSVNTTLSPEQQLIADQQNIANLNLSTLGADLSGQLQEQLTQNFSLGNEETEAYLYDLGSARLDPQFQQAEEDLQSRLANQGIYPGTEAYDREMTLLSQQENDAYNQLLLTGRSQASQELLAEDNQRINQISALLTGSQVSQPTFQTGNSITPAPTTDNASIIANADAAAAAAAAQSQASTASMIGGLGGLFALSDPDAKTDKKKIAETDDGIGIFSFKYKGSDKTEIGLMADEIARKKPAAVRRRPDGLREVNYGKALK